MTKRHAANLAAIAVLAAMVATASMLGLRGTVDAAYGVGYSLGSLARMF